jgi:beta-glucosidase
VKPFSAYDPEAKKILAQMSLDEKIGQMTQPDQQFLKSIDDIEKYHLGSLFSGGDSDPATGNDLRSWTDLYDRFQSRALKTRLHIPLLYGIDAVHGNNNVLGATIFPHNIGLGCTRNPALVRQISQITAEEIRATGINWAFAPCVTVPQDIRWGRTYEGYSDSPEVVKQLGEASVLGLQQGGLSNPLAVLGCAKHFAGDGGTVWGTGTAKRDGVNVPLDHGDVRLPEEAFIGLHLQGYITAIRAGVGSIMPSYNSWNGVKCTGNRLLLTGILKGKLGFEGFLISDYNATDELPGDYKAQVAMSINAGMDMVMVPERYAQFFETLKALVNDGTVPLSRIDDAVTRILRVKIAMGLLDPHRSFLADRSIQASFGSAEHRKVARQAVRESLVILKNENHILPLAKTAARIHVSGKSADDLGNQCGGWTVTWQGGSGDTIKGGKLTGTTILAGMRASAGKATQITYSKDGSGAAGATLGVVVVGEKPYAEMFGDHEDLRLSNDDLATIHTLKSAGIPVVVVLVSGRPMFIEDVLSEADAVVAAWLPGTEGDGVADILFGANKPHGKLSFTWPKSSSKTLHLGDSGYETLFPVGFGLTY